MPGIDFGNAKLLNGIINAFQRSVACISKVKTEELPPDQKILNPYPNESISESLSERYKNAHNAWKTPENAFGNAKMFNGFKNAFQWCIACIGTVKTCLLYTSPSPRD